MNQSKLEVVKQEMARVNIDILGIREIKWKGMNLTDDCYIYYCGQEPLRRNGVAIILYKKVRNAVLGCRLKNNRMISVHFQGNPLNITLIQVYVPITNAKEAEVEQFYDDIQDLLEVTPKKKKKKKKKRCPFHHKGLECKSRKSRDTWSNRQV